MKQRLLFPSVRIILRCACWLLGFSFLFYPNESEAKRISHHHKTASELSAKKQPGQTSNPNRRIISENDSALFKEYQKGISIHDYDHMAHTATETMLVTNAMSDTIHGVETLITYLNMDGGMIHKRKFVRILELPPYETRMISVPTLEQNHSLYYYKSKAPGKGGKPYKVDLKLISVTLGEDQF